MQLTLLFLKEKKGYHVWGKKNSYLSHHTIIFIRARVIRIKVDKDLKAILEKNPVGIEQIYTKYQPRIIRYVRENNGTVGDGEDLFQESLIVIFKQARAQQLELTVSFYTYLFAVAKRLWLKKLRKKRKSGVTFSEDLEYIDDNQLEIILLEEERHSLFRAKFRALSGQCRQLLNMFFQKVPMKDIVKRMGLSSVSYAKKRKFQCKEKLIALIKEDDQFDELK